jgi:hypothetical protein
LGWLRGFREQLQEWGELLAVIAVTESSNSRRSINPSNHATRPTGFS